MTQNEALMILKTGRNVFLTGEPGSGKTHTINRFVSWLRGCGVEPAITASTGIAATHIGGYTIHSWSGIGIARDLAGHDLDRMAGNKKLVRRVRNAHILIIDEVSMLSAKTLSMVEAVCRRLRGGSQPFGGLQVVLVGDFFQLPPVWARDVEVQRDIRQIAFASPNDASHAQFAFLSPAWGALDPLACYLSEQHRQEDPVFLELLSAIRRGSVSESHQALLERRLREKPRSGVTRLFSHNADVDRMNKAELEKLPGRTRVFEMESRGPEKLTAQLRKGCLSPELLALKVGARVMFTKNNLREGFVNGTLGTVQGFSQNNGHPIVETNAGKTIAARSMEWTIEESGRVLAGVAQVPLRLAWAITVHKSQGMSLDAAEMDLSDAFEYGQGYVALSRVRMLSGLSLAGLNERALETHPDVRLKDAEFREQSSVTREMFSKTSQAELSAMHANFIRVCGGQIQENEDSAEKRLRKKEGDFTVVPKARRWRETLQLVSEGRDIEEVARIRGRTAGTILAHLEKLHAIDKIQPDTVLHLLRGREEIYAEIHEAFRLLGTERLRPIFDHLGGRVPFETIRLARLLFKKPPRKSSS